MKLLVAKMSIWFIYIYIYIYIYNRFLYPSDKGNSTFQNFSVPVCLTFQARSTETGTREKPCNLKRSGGRAYKGGSKVFWRQEILKDTLLHIYLSTYLPIYLPIFSHDCLPNLRPTLLPTHNTHIYHTV